MASTSILQILMYSGVMSVSNSMFINGFQKQQTPYNLDSLAASPSKFFGFLGLSMSAMALTGVVIYYKRLNHKITAKGRT